ncbi:Hypothetical protein SCF082_LOCUS45682 [Durusdinium trenchii]|uniref:Uncharacterized protein n=1 Tax=Durusdinium trenchii TaxID=1381693 RepID=A0ABP0RCA9_9DINO
MNSPRAWWQLPDGDGDDDHGEEAKVHILAEPGTPARSQSSGTGTEGLAEGWQSLRLASSTMRSSEMKSKPKRFQQVLNQWIRRPPDRERLHRLAKPVRRKTQEASFELTLVHPNRTFDTTHLVELAAPKQEKKPVPLAPQLRRPLNLIRLKELAEPQAVGGVWGRGGSAGWPGLGSSHVRVQEVLVALALGAPDLAEEAKKASEEAWEHAKELKKSSKDAAKIADEVKAAGEGAKEAVKKAKELDAKMSALYESTRQSTVAAATEAAMAYYAEVKEAGAQAAAEAASPARRGAAAAAQEAQVAAAAIDAAMPYHEAQLKAQKRAMEYQQHAQAMNTAGQQLEVEGARLAPHAQGYQMVGKVDEANQIIRTAHLLVDQGLKLKRQAKSIHQSAVELNDALPQYATAEQAAILHAAAMAAGPTLPTNAPPY